MEWKRVCSLPQARSLGARGERKGAAGKGNEGGGGAGQRKRSNEE